MLVTEITAQSIDAALRKQLDALNTSVESRETGSVIQVGDGIARVDGLKNAMAGELLEFTSSTGQVVYGMAQNLEEDEVGAVLLGDVAAIKENDAVKTTGRLVEVPSGKALLGRVVNPLGMPLDGKGEIKAEGTRPRVMVTTRKVMNTLMENAAVMKYFYAGQAQSDMLPAFIGEAQVRGVLSSYANISDVLLVDETYEEFARQQKIILPGGVASFFPENTVLLLPGLNDTGLGYTALGPTAEAKQSTVYGISRQYDAGPIGAILDIPSATPGYEAYVNGTMLPVLVQSNSTLKATVLNG